LGGSIKRLQAGQYLDNRRAFEAFKRDYFWVLGQPGLFIPKKNQKVNNYKEEKQGNRAKILVISRKKRRFLETPLKKY